MKSNHPLLNRMTEVEVVDDTNEPWVLVRCLETDFHYLSNPPKYDRLSEEFAWQKTIEIARDRRHQEERLISVASSVAKKIKFLLNPNRDKMFQLAHRVLSQKSQTDLRVLDVGCGNGKKMAKFCQRFESIGTRITPLGIEVSSQLATESDARFSELGGNVIEANAIDGMREINPESVDMVTMLSFLEHESQPLQLMNAIHQALKPEGSIVIKVPNFESWNRKVRGSRWAGFRFPDHVSYFTPATLNLLASQTGFRLLTQNLFDRMPTNDNMYAVFQKA